MLLIKGDVLGWLICLLENVCLNLASFHCFFWVSSSSCLHSSLLSKVWWDNITFHNMVTISPIDIWHLTLKDEDRKRRFYLEVALTLECFQPQFLVFLLKSCGVEGCCAMILHGWSSRKRCDNWIGSVESCWGNHHICHHPVQMLTWSSGSG